MAERIAAALAEAGYDRAHDDEPAAAAFVIWSPSAARSPEILAASRAALARRVLVPVAVGKAPPPSSFEHLWPIDLAGWSGSSSDARWKFVLDEVELAVRRGVRLPAGSAASATPPSASDVFIDGADEPGAFPDAPIPAGVRPPPTARVPRAAMFGAAAAIALVTGGVVIAVAASTQKTQEARVETQPPVIAFVNPKEPDTDEFAASAPAPEEPREIVTASLESAGVLRDVETSANVDAAPETEFAAAVGEAGDASADAPAAESAEDVAEQFAAASSALQIEGAVALTDLPHSDEGAGAATMIAAAPADEALIEQPLTAPEMVAEGDGDRIAELAWTATGEAAAELASAPVEQPVEAPGAEEEPASYGRYLRDCLDCPDLAEIDAGVLEPEPNGDLAVPLMLRGPIAVAVTETTYDDWQKCVNDGACPSLSDSGWGRGKRPVVNVTYAEAEGYANWLAAKTGQPYRLPTETEWEYAARAGSLDAYSFGTAIVATMANFTAPGGARGRTLPAGNFAPNRFGLYDMHGNAAEWTADCWTGGEGTTLVGSFCSARVIKGGAWDSAGEDVRASARNGGPAGARRNDVGFRVVRDVR
ncbi:MAG: SUMF1/EgtB/PvdO family nonheme iron enzyme [Parvularculaceae bacterium]|nr:SUMF1/EgtB/PvdO family nonheme iron enzyme [Parvularculaceae bacterium]